LYIKVKNVVPVPFFFYDMSLHYCTFKGGGMDPIPELGAHLQAMRERRGLSITQLAIAAGTSYQNIWRIEHGTQRDPSLALMRALARALGVSLDYLSDTFGVDSTSCRAEDRYGGRL
jgi:DNA-binding XRE family transcriptional regulator